MNQERLKEMQKLQKKQLREKLRNQQLQFKTSIGRQVVPYDCQTAYKDDEFLHIADNMMQDIKVKGDGKGVRQRYLLMMSQIKEKVSDLGMTSSARRVVQKPTENTSDADLYNKLIKMMKARRKGNTDDPESTILTP